MLKHFYTNDEMESLFRSKKLQYPSLYSLDQLIKKMRESKPLDVIFKTPHPTIAVIGNSGKLLNQEYGQLIDSHDIVIRCNLAIVKGFENHVGNKTNFRVIAGKSFWRDLQDHFSSYDKNFLNNLENEHFLIKADPLYNAIQGVIKNYNTKCNISYIKQETINHIQNKINIPDISTGFTALSLALMWSTNVSLFGFNFFEEGWSEQHYFEKITPYNRGHKLDLEKNHIKYLKTKKIINVY